MNGEICKPEQRHILDQFREIVSDVLKPEHDDYFLLRWLRARQFDIPKAETMLRKSMRWRKQLGIDYLLTHFVLPEVVTKYVPTAFLGFDKDGCSVRLYPQGTVDFKGLTAAVERHNIVKSVALTYEYDLQLMRKLAEKTGKRTEKFVFIADYEGFSLMQVASKLVMDAIFDIVRAFEANYPESLKLALIINVPPLFSTLYAAVKPLLAEETRNKFKFFGKTGWKEELLKIMEADLVPVYLGGTRTDINGDPRCCSIISQGGLIDEKYFLRNMSSYIPLAENPEAFHVVIDGKSMHRIEIDVPYAISLIEWQIGSDGDLDIGLERVKSKDGNFHDVEQIIPMERRSCYAVPDAGTYYCEKPGIYILQIENTYSKYRGRSIIYTTKVTVPEKTYHATKALDLLNWIIQE